MTSELQAWKSTVVAASKLLKIVVDRKAINRQKVPLSWTVGKESIKIKLTVTTSNLNDMMIKPNRLCRTKFL